MGVVIERLINTRGHGEDVKFRGTNRYTQKVNESGRNSLSFQNNLETHHNHTYVTITAVHKHAHATISGATLLTY